MSSSTKWKYEVVVFDIDGTLIRGPNFDYSWKLIWDYKSLPGSLHHAYMRKYLEGKLTYEQWCAEVVSSLRKADLRRSEMADIVKDLTLTNKLRPTLKTLKREGFKCVIVSGGVDALLYQMMPDVEEYFDLIFINKLQFDAAGLVEGVVPTKYDFAGKADGIRFACEKFGCKISRSVFVGEAFNDEDAMRVAGLSIAYPPKDARVRAFATVAISEDDLSEILEYVLVPRDDQEPDDAQADSHAAPTFTTVPGNSNKRFQVALSFPGECRGFVLDVAESLSQHISRDQIFYDEWYEAELLGEGGDLKLQQMYDDSDLIVPFFFRVLRQAMVRHGVDQDSRSLAQQTRR